MAEEPVVLHKQVFGEQRRLHVIEKAFKISEKQNFHLSFDYHDINGPEKGIYYRHALGKKQLFFGRKQLIFCFSMGRRTNQRSSTYSTDQTNVTCKR